jgi:hypothetical protein
VEAVLHPEDEPFDCGEEARDIVGDGEEGVVDVVA